VNLSTLCFYQFKTIYFLKIDEDVTEIGCKV
jgi:hypothetical protein